MNRRKFAQTLGGALVAAAMQLGCSTRLDKPTPPDGRLTNAELEEIYQRLLAEGGRLTKSPGPGYTLVYPTNEAARNVVEAQGHWLHLETIQAHDNLHR